MTCMTLSSLFQRNSVRNSTCMGTKPQKLLVSAIFASLLGCLWFILLPYDDLLARVNYSSFVQSRTNQTHPVSPFTQHELLRNSTGTTILPPPACDYNAAITKSRYCLLHKLLSTNSSETQIAKDYINTIANKQGHYISTCTAVRAAGDIIHEFIVRNYLAGVDHFYIFDDEEQDSKDNLTELLKELSPLITFATLPSVRDFLKQIGRPGETNLRVAQRRQHMYYWHCFETYGNRSKWLLPIDTDEFLEAKHPEKHDSKTAVFEETPFMQEYLRKIEHKEPAQIGRFTSVFTNNRLFPPKPEGQTLAESYPMTCGRKDAFRRHYEARELFSAKSAVQAKYIDYEAYKMKGQFFGHGMRHSGPSESAQELHFIKPYQNLEISINTTETEWTILHYWCRSLADYALKQARGRLSGGPRRSLSELMNREKKCRRYRKKEVSESARRRIPMVRALLNQIGSFSTVQMRYYLAKLEAVKEENANDVIAFKEWLISQGEFPA